MKKWHVELLGIPSFSCFFFIQLDLEWLAGFPSGDALLWHRNASGPLEGPDIRLARQNGFACLYRLKVRFWIMIVWNVLYLIRTFVCFCIMIFRIWLYTIWMFVFESWSVPGGNCTYIGDDHPRTCSYVGVFELEAAVNLFKDMWPQKFYWTRSFHKSCCKSSHIIYIYRYIYIPIFEYLKKHMFTNVTTLYIFSSCQTWCCKPTLCMKMPCPPHLAGSAASCRPEPLPSTSAYPSRDTYNICAGSFAEAASYRSCRTAAS